MSQAIKNREAFFDHLEEGLQNYFNLHDRFFGGILHLTVGVRCGRVGGIIKSENAFRYEGFTTERVKEILRHVLPRYVPRTEVPYAIAAVLEELRMDMDDPTPKKVGRPKKDSNIIND